MIENTRQSSIEDQVPLQRTTFVTAELLDSVQPSFVQMLMHQNKNHENRIERILRLERLQQISLMIWLSSAISFLCFVLFFIGEMFPSWMWLALGTIFGILFLLSIVVGASRLDDHFHSHLSGIFRWRIRRTFSKTSMFAPFEANYSFENSKLLTTVELLKIRKETSLKKIAIAYRAEKFYCLFRSRTTQFWKAIVYISDEINRDEIDQFLIEQDIELIGLENSKPSEETQPIGEN